MARNERKYHDNFIKYQEFIVDHRNYNDLPMARGNDGKIKWVTAGKSELGQKRKAWWLAKSEELKSLGTILPDHAPLSPICLHLHPTKAKPCQTCGREMSLEYVYPSKNTLKAINKIGVIDENEEDFRTIYEILDILEANQPQSYKKLDKVFKGIASAASVEKAKELVCNEYVQKFSKKLSPGAMSNCPDRLDGFHSYNKCCRAKEDTGRHASNLSRYGEDRRAYENWADGDWKSASWLMKVFNQHGVSADHIGPISLGFTHRPVFQPMSSAENSSKGNRMSLSDFNKIIADEEAGEHVVSWHTLPIWNRLKSHVYDEHDVSELCKYMRRNMHYILTVLAQLHSDGLEELLESFLNPVYANYSIKFKGFDPETGTYEEMIKTAGDMTQYSRNATRYKRIAFEQLNEYKSKTNRKTPDLSDSILQSYSAQVRKALHEDGVAQAKEVLIEIFDQLAASAEEEFISGKELRQSLLDD